MKIKFWYIKYDEGVHCGAQPGGIRPSSFFVSYLKRRRSSSDDKLANRYRNQSIGLAFYFFRTVVVLKNNFNNICNVNERF